MATEKKLSNEEILSRAIEKAVEGGFDFDSDETCAIYNGDFGYVCHHHIIFSHSFAKAFWGEGGLKHHCKADKNNMAICSCTIVECGWEYHLQQMVLEEEPLQYLKKFICLE